MTCFEQNTFEAGAGWPFLPFQAVLAVTTPTQAQGRGQGKFLGPDPGVGMRSAAPVRALAAFSVEAGGDKLWSGSRG